MASNLAALWLAVVHVLLTSDLIIPTRLRDASVSASWYLIKTLWTNLDEISRSIEWTLNKIISFWLTNNQRGSSWVQFCSYIPAIKIRVVQSKFAGLPTQRKGTFSNTSGWIEKKLHLIDFVIVTRRNRLDNKCMNTYLGNGNISRGSTATPRMWIFTVLENMRCIEFISSFICCLNYCISGNKLDYYLLINFIKIFKERKHGNVNCS